MSAPSMDFAKVLAVLSQPKETPPPLEHVEIRFVEIPYITKENKVDKRKIRIYLPENAARPMPLIFVPHYEMMEDATELRAYLNEGWAVSSPTDGGAIANASLTDDDLVFNNAALYTLRHMPEFDLKRVALVGGSAGAYMTLMLNGLKTGLCASIANGPIANTYFTLYCHFAKTQELNMAAMAKLMQEPQEEAITEENPAIALMKKLARLPVPFVAALAGNFQENLKNYPDRNDTGRWEALCGMGVAERFGSPIMVNHSTSDILVPVDQITRKYTYEHPGASLPQDYSCRLPKDLPGKLSCTLEDRLPPDETRTERFVVPTPAPECDLPYDPAKRFNINIFDDGPVEGFGSHSSRMDVGRRNDVPYLKDMFARTADRTATLTPAMLQEYLDRWEGKSIALPGHTNVDDTAYGSLCVYRKEIVEELRFFGKERVRKTAEALIGTESLSETASKILTALE